MTRVRFLTYEQVLRIHRDSIQRYGGSPELRDRGLLESALAQPQAMYGGEYLHGTTTEMAAAYCFHLVKNHAFVDGNKRVGAEVARVFLLVNQFRFEPSQEVYEALILDLAAGKLDKSHVAAFFHQHARPG